MHETIQKTALLVMAVGIGALAVGWLSFSQARSGYEDVTRNTMRLERISKEVQELRELASQVASNEGETSLEPSTWIAMGSSVGINQNQMAEITEIPVQAIPNSEYDRHSTLIRLDNITLASLVSFLQKVHEDIPGMRTELVRFTDPAPNASSSGQPQDERWKVNLLLTQLVFNAKSR